MKQVKKLEPKATIGLIAPSGPAARPDLITKGVDALKALDFRVVVGPGCYEKWGYMAGSDQVRIKDIHTFFADPAIDGIFCMKGGDGAPRLLDRLDYDLIAANPKVFVGYSDITGLHMVFNQRAGFVTFHGPMPVSDFIYPDFTEYERHSLLQAVMSPEPPGEIETPAGASPVEILSPGRAAGRLTGGNLALICALMGTPFEIETKGKILLIEDIDEANYRIDRMLTQLRLAGKLDDAAGIAIGQFTNAEPGDANKKLPLEEVLKSILPRDKPILSNLHIGHGPRKATIPLGAMAEIDGDKGSLVITESGVY